MNIYLIKLKVWKGDIKDFCLGLNCVAFLDLANCSFMTLKRIKNVKKKKKVVFEHFLSHLIGAIKEDAILCITM